MEEREVTQVIISIKEDISSLRADLKAAFKRIDEQREQSQALVNVQLTMARIEEKFDAALKKLLELEKRIHALEANPAKFLWIVITGVVSAGIGWAMSLIKR